MRFVEREYPEGRPRVPDTAVVSLSPRARAQQGWRTDPAIGNLDKGLLALLALLPEGQPVPVQAIAARVDEHQVEVLAAVSRMFSIGLVDVEGMTTRNRSGDSVVS